MKKIIFFSFNKSQKQNKGSEIAKGDYGHLLNFLQLIYEFSKLANNAEEQGEEGKKTKKANFPF